MSTLVKRLCGLIISILLALLATYLNTGCSFEKLSMTADKGKLVLPSSTPLPVP